MKEGSARRSFRLKVEKLERAVIDGVVPEGVPSITKVDDLRQWKDPSDRNISSWSSFSVAAPGGRNADLRARLDKVLASFVKLQSGKDKRGPKPPRSMTVSDWLVQQERDALLLQNSQFLARALEAEQDSRSKDVVIASQAARIAELSAALRKIAPLRGAG